MSGGVPSTGHGKRVPPGKHGGKTRSRAGLAGAQAGITKGDIRRLARRGGVKRISGLVYDEVRDNLTAFVKQIMQHAVIYTEYAKRRTVIPTDIRYALKRNGVTLYGFGGL